MESFGGMLRAVGELVGSADGRDEALAAVCRLLADGVAHYDWVGFYVVDETGEALTLGPYVGEATEHTRIAFGEGICGQAAERLETFLVQDVSKETNYLSCSPVVKSEIVVPVMKAGRIVAELDIDSHVLSPFAAEDRAFLEDVAEAASRLF